jgi:nitrite reductase/ring-hydroxylating ferredoxin subunit
MVQLEEKNALLDQVIPKERYLSRSFAQREADRLWPYVWQIACREEELRHIGDFVEYEIVDQSILLVRVAPETIKAFFNVCPHRGNQLKHGCGNAKEIRCRYHSWRWHLDGTIKEVVDAYDYDPECMDPSRLGLAECLVACWGGFVFITMDRSAEPLEDFLGPVVRERLGRYEFEHMCYARYKTTVVPANWKTVMDAFGDFLHTQGIHPQLLLFLDDEHWTYEQHGLHSVFIPSPGTFGRISQRLGGFAAERSETLLFAVEELLSTDLFNEEELEGVQQLIGEMAKAIPEDMPLNQFFAFLRRQQALSEGDDLSAYADDDLLISDGWNLFPNMFLPGNVGNALVFRIRPQGLEPESCIVDVWSLKRNADGAEIPMVEREFYADPQDHQDWGRAVTQDFANIATVQRGMHCRAFARLILGRQDASVANFHRSLMTYLDRQEEEPCPGE